MKIWEWQLLPPQGHHQQHPSPPPHCAPPAQQVGGSCHQPQSGQSVQLTFLFHINYPPECAGPYSEWDMPGKLRFIWDYKEDDVLIIPSDLGDLYSQYYNAKRSGPHATQSNQVERVIHKISQQQYREFVLAHITRCHHVNLTATVSQSIDLTPLDLETYQSLRANPMCGWPVGKKQGGMACSCNSCSYFLMDFLGWVPSFANPPLCSLNAPCTRHEKSPDEDNPSQSICHSTHLSL